MSAWWEQKFSVCSECGVHFEPVTGYEARWGNLCSTHRKPVKERDLKMDRVISWASRNVERVAKIMDDETADQAATIKNMMLNFGQRAAAQNQRNNLTTNYPTNTNFDRKETIERK